MGFSGLAERVAEVRQRIDAARARGQGQSVRLIAVTKTHGAEAVLAAEAAGIADVGENKVQEAVGKQVALREAGTMPSGIRWHLIGHLQTNKVKQLDRFDLLHALDRPRLADAVSEQAMRSERVFDVLMQVNVVGEESKGGYALADVQAAATRLRELSGLRVRGVMTMAPFDADEPTLRRVFRGAREARERLQDAGLPAEELSMGMSGDYEIAVEEGATLLRLGTVLFGARS
ncbi:MAG: YggS family pyridoxal phosphate-dependent enzyme [Gemmatimonadaceae bacterium]|nr:YggS family pyridoxal phosphate-dependent enzyme [Gemmatimonadaceae bacterium]